MIWAWVASSSGTRDKRAEDDVRLAIADPRLALKTFLS